MEGADPGVDGEMVKRMTGVSEWSECDIPLFFTSQ